MFAALVLEEGESGHSVAVRDVSEADLPEGDVTVDVAFSTVNYKDGLAVVNGKPVVRSFPMVPGIDFAGAVTESSHGTIKVGDTVVLNGFGVGEGHWGGFAQRARVNGDWLVKLPSAISPRDAMAIGTAGYTAMLCVLALEDNGVTPRSGDVLVTGAAGGVGSVAIAILAKLGYRVVASSGRAEAEGEYLRSLGAAEVIDRTELSVENRRPLQKERFGAAVDAVGSYTLANAIASMAYGGTVAACGLAQGADLPTTVLPFILRGVTLAGVDSVMAPLSARQRAWDRLATDLDAAKLASMTSVIGLSEVGATCAAILEGKVRGRVVVDVHA